MKNFENWYSELISDQIWSEPAMMHHKPKTFEDCARKVYMQCVADGVFKSMQECRKHVYNIVCKTPGDKQKVDWVAKALKKAEDEQKEEWKPASPEHVDKCVAEFDEMLKNAPMLNSCPRMPYKQQVEEGGWLPKKGAPYPMTSTKEYYIKERHVAYLQYCYEARTGEKLPTWIEESEFNLLYDNQML